MAKIIKWVLIELAIFAVFITGSVILITRYIQPYMNADSDMPRDGVFVFRQTDSGELVISWPEADRADYYIFQMFQLPNGGQMSYQNDAGKLVYEKKVTNGTSVTLQADAYTGNMRFRVASAVRYEMEQKERVRMGDRVLEVVTEFEAPAIGDITCTTNRENQTAAIHFETTNATVCQVSLLGSDGEKKILKTVDGDNLTLTFGEGGDLPVPAFGKAAALLFSVYREMEDIVYYSADYALLSIDRAMLVPSDIFLRYTYDYDLLNCRLSWQAEECDYYELQVLDPATGIWSALAVVNADEERSYLIEGLEKDTVLVLRVAAAYEKVTESADGEPQSTVVYRSISNEIGISEPDPNNRPVVPPTDPTTPPTDPTIPPEEPVLFVGTVLAQTLQIRAGTGNNYIIMGTLECRDEVEILEVLQVGDIQWGRIEAGWIQLKSIQIHEEGYEPVDQSGTITAVSLRIRAGAGTDYAVVGTLYQSNHVEIFGIKTVNGSRWARIDKGWILIDYVKIDSDDPSLPTQRGVITASSLRIRAGTGTGFAVVGTLKMGDIVEILEIVKVGDSYWGRIDQGWISMDYVQLIEEDPEDSV